MQRFHTSLKLKKNKMMVGEGIEKRMERQRTRERSHTLNQEKSLEAATLWGLYNLLMAT